MSLSDHEGSQPKNPAIPFINLGASIEGGSNATSLSDTELSSSQTAAAPGESTNAGRKDLPTSSDNNLITDINQLAFGNSPARRDPLIAKVRNSFVTDVDIIGVPAIGGDPEKTWASRPVLSQDQPGVRTRPIGIQKAILEATAVSPAVSRSPSKAISPRAVDTIEPAWIRRGIRNHENLHNARVLLYDHGIPEGNDNLKILANRLLKNIQDLRRIESRTQPIFFICHSTGGLVVKMALAEAKRSKNPILGDCYGVTFFATPHRGSSYLSMPSFSHKIKEIMCLSRSIPGKIANQLRLNHPLLCTIDTDFKALATDLRIWTFIETEDSDLGNPGVVESERFPFHAPITSIKSSLLNLRHEVIYPLRSNHTECAAFRGENKQTKESYLKELAVAVTKACALNKIRHTEMNLEDRVKVEIHGFYERNAPSSINDEPLRVASTSRTLFEFMRDGPQQLLRERAAEVTAPPREKQHIRQATRARSLLPDKQRGSKVDSSLGIDSQEPTSSKTRLITSIKRPGRSRSKEQAIHSLTAESKSMTVPSVLIVPTEHGNNGDSNDLSGGNLQLPRSISRTPTAAPLRPDSPFMDQSVHMGQSFNATNFSDSRRNSEARSEPDYLTPLAAHADRPSRVRRGSEGAIHHNTLATFTKPDESMQRMVWIHMPHNNPSWVKDVLQRISVDQGRNCHEKLLSADHWESKHVRGRHSEHHACFLKPGCSFIVPELTSPNATPSKNGTQSTDSMQMCLYLPYLHFDTYKSLVRRRTLIKQRIKQGRSRPVPQHVAKLESIELRVIWQFLGHDPPVNCRRTLDQFGYPSLVDTRARDDDQMLYKITKQRCAHPDDDLYELDQRKLKRNNSSNSQLGVGAESENEEAAVGSEDSDDEDSESEPDADILDGNVLMVDQLWLWIVDSGTTVTFFPKKEALPTDGRLYQQADLRNSIFNEVNADLTSRCENSFDLAALVALHAVTVLFERSSHPDLEIFRTFEEAISILTEKMTTSFKRFRARGFRDKAIDYNDAVRTTNIRAKHKLEGSLAEKQNRENTSALLELRDIEDELQTLKILFKHQETAIGLMIEHYQQEHMKSLTANGLLFLNQAAHSLTEYTGQADKMIKNVRDTRDDFDKLLQMVQRQAQVDEVRLARLQADLASAQSRSVMIFTVFTVIFLPLTFFTGLFGMNTREWGGGKFLPLHTIGKIAIPTSFVIITLALIVAWSTRMRRTFNIVASSTHNGTRQVKKKIVEMIAYLTVEGKGRDGRKKSMQEKRERKRLRKEVKREASWLDEDFWEGHVARREKDYRVPPQNRRSVGEARKKIEGRERLGGRVRVGV